MAEPVNPNVPPPPQLVPMPEIGARPQPQGMAVASLVLGIIGVVPCCCLMAPSVLAIIFGAIALSNARRGVGGGESMARAGMILGAVGLALGMFWILIHVVLVFLRSGGHYGYHHSWHV